MLKNAFEYIYHTDLIYWLGIPIALIIIMALYSQLRKRRSTEN